jgi:hypothetical protein
MLVGFELHCEKLRLTTAVVVHVAICGPIGIRVFVSALLAISSIIANLVRVSGVEVA